MDLKFWTKALKEAERELEVAKTRTALDAAAKKLMRAKEALKALESERPSGWLSRGCGRWALPHDLLGFVDVEARLLQVLYDPLGELPAGIVAHVIFPIRRRRSRHERRRRPPLKCRGTTAQAPSVTRAQARGQEVGLQRTMAGEGRFMFKRSLVVGALALALILPDLQANAQSDRRSAVEAYARVVDYPLLIEKAATRRTAELPASERGAYIEFITEEVDFEMTRFYAISAMVDLFEASELQALASFAATPEGRSALAKLPALGAVLTPIVERQITDAERSFRER